MRTTFSRVLEEGSYPVPSRSGGAILDAYRAFGKSRNRQKSSIVKLFVLVLIHPIRILLAVDVRSALATPCRVDRVTWSDVS